MDTKKNLAIIIGVSEYENLQSLTACKNDAEIMYTLLNSIENKYMDILYIVENTNSVNVKNQLSNFIEKHCNSKINEIFFYYSGHGYYNGNEFFYLFSDYHFNNQYKASYTNTDLDKMLRNLKAELSIKVIDACNSEIQYIKSNKSIKDFFKESENSFKDCYFMFSSRNYMSSLATEKISDFSKSFFESIYNHNIGETIRYKDITNYISDSFLNMEQKPVFVNQALLTEKFATITPNIKDNLKSLLDKTCSVNTLDKKTRLLEIIKADSEKYCTKNDFIKTLDDMKNYIQKLKYSDRVNEIFDLKVEFNDDYDDIQNLNKVGNWLDENENDFFVEYNYIERHRLTGEIKIEPNLEEVIATNKEDYEVGAYHGFIEALNSINYEKIITGIQITDELPYKSVNIEFVPKYPNVNKYICKIIFVYSKTKIRLFYYFNFLKKVNWNDEILVDEITWNSRERYLKGFDFKTIDHILEGFENFVISNLKSKYSIIE